MSCQFPLCNRHAQANGFCISHQGYGPAVAQAKKAYRIPAKSDKKLAQEKKEKEGRGDSETELQKWYSHIMATEKPICWETGEKISTKDPENKKAVDGWRGSIAHVLPKKLFPSVATHPDNYLILKMWGGVHSRYDMSWESAQRMKVWPLAVERFIKMWPSIADKEKKYIPNCLLKHIPEQEQI